MIGVEVYPFKDHQWIISSGLVFLEILWWINSYLSISDTNGFSSLTGWQLSHDKFYHLQIVHLCSDCTNNYMHPILVLRFPLSWTHSSLSHPISFFFLLSIPWNYMVAPACTTIKFILFSLGTAMKSIATNETRGATKDNESSPLKFNYLCTSSWRAIITIDLVNPTWVSTVLL